MTKLSAYINGLTEDTTPDTASDMLLEYDASATASKKLKLATLLALASGGGLGADGWASADAMTYASADSPTFTMTCAGDQTGKYWPGQRIKLTQTTVKYFIVTAVAYSSSTTITLYGGTDYTLANAAITSPYYSSAKAPLGFPLDPAKWSVRVTDTTPRVQTNPAASTWYNPGTTNQQIVVPIGLWKLGYKAMAYIEKSPSGTTYIDVFVTLSTANNSESDDEMTQFGQEYTATAAMIAATVSAYIEKAVTLASKTTYYLNGKANQSGMTKLTIGVTGYKTVLWAICAYL